MKVLTPELWLHSAISGTNTTAALETRELDFDLARRSAIIINQIESYILLEGDVLTGFDDTAGIVQEIDLDPDDVDVLWSDAVALDDVVYDSSRVFRHRGGRHFDSATGSVQSFDTTKMTDWSLRPLTERPITTRNIRHNVEVHTIIVANYEAEVTIRYQIVELTLEELGYINASRR